MMYGPCICWHLSKVVGLTCRLGSELVPVGGAHSQQPVAQVQVKPLLSSYATHHLEEERQIMSTVSERSSLNTPLWP